MTDAAPLDVKILRRLMDHWSYQQIADDLHMSQKEVRKRVEVIYDILDAKNHDEAFQVAYQRGWFNRS